jgi:molecular chaperone GrpE
VDRSDEENEMTIEINRDAILRRFETLLDSALTPEAPPAGLDPSILTSVLQGNPEDQETRSDSYALWSAMTLLAQEVKLQGRAFQELNQTLSSQAAKAAEELRAAYAERERAARRDAERASRREVLSGLIDLRDRLLRGRELVGAELEKQRKPAPEPKGWRKFFSAAQEPGPGAEASPVDALIRGYELSIERLDQTLDEFGAREIRSLGEPFDPRRMNAIEREDSASVPDGTVLEVYRGGYEWNGEIFRTAQVKVSRAPGGSEA